LHTHLIKLLLSTCLSFIPPSAKLDTPAIAKLYPTYCYVAYLGMVAIKTSLATYCFLSRVASIYQLGYNRNKAKLYAETRKHQPHPLWSRWSFNSWWWLSKIQQIVFYICAKLYFSAVLLFHVGGKLYFLYNKLFSHTFH
jgi:hypothetical protein